MSLNRYKNSLPVYAAKQQGFVLVLALVMLTVLTLIGVSSMKRANMELRTTANARQHMVAFDAVQSLLEYTTSDTGAAAIDYQTITPNSISSVPGIPDVSAASGTVSYIGCVKAIGSSWEEGKGFSYSYFRVDGVASNLTGTATSSQSHGVRYPAAGC